MAVLRINEDPTPARSEEVWLRIKQRLPLAYLRLKTGRGYIDFLTDASREKLREVRDWLHYCGCNAELRD